MNEILKKNQKFGIDLSYMGIKELEFHFAPAPVLTPNRVKP